MSTGTTLAHHLQALATGNVDTILEDYTDESVLFAPQATFRGREQLRIFFEGALLIFTPEVLSQFQILRQDVDGEIAYIFWTAGSAIPLGTDTFVVRDGKIVVQTFAAHMA